MPINYAAVVKAADAIVMLRCPACTALCGGLAEGTYRTVCRWLAGAASISILFMTVVGLFA